MDTCHPVHLPGAGCHCPMVPSPLLSPRHLCTWEDGGSAVTGTSQSQETLAVGWGDRVAGCGGPGTLRLVPDVSKPPTWP